MGQISQAAARWAEKRGLSVPTLEQLGVGSGTTRMPKSASADVIAFPYRKGGRVVNVKYRALSEKDFRQQEGGEIRFWNLDAVLAMKADEVFIFEGEIDALSAVEAGIPAAQVVSVPNGAPAQSSETPQELDRYRYVQAGIEEGFGRCRAYILATDNDPPGQALRQDLARLLGPAKCRFVDWPEGIKDANEFLLRHGPEGLRLFLDEAQQEWPVVGLYRLSEIPEPPPLELWRTGFPEWESKLLFAPTMLNIFTGFPGHGKTTLDMQLVYQMCRDYGLKAAVASFETRPKPHHRRNVRQFMYGRREHELTEQQRLHADRWIEDNLLWMVHPNQRPSLNWLLDMAAGAIHRHGARIVVIDPWNKLDGDRPPGMPETEWIGQSLDLLLDFAVSYRVLVQVLCHPAKNNDPRARSRAPTLDDIAGSAHWRNRADIGLSVWRPQTFDNGVRKTEAELHVLKVKYDELGHECILPIDYDLKSGRYRATDYKMAYE